MLVVLGVVGGYLRLVYGIELRQAVWLFDLSNEQTFATWYASLLFLFSAFLLVLIAVVHRGSDRGKEAVYWGGLAVVFLLLSADEVAMVHEWTANLAPAGRGVFYYSWVFAGLALVGGLSVVYVPFVLRQNRRLRLLLVAAAVVFVGGALGMEMLNAWLEDYYPSAQLAYMLTTAVEESMELAGLIVFVYALLDHLRLQKAQLSLSFSDEAP